MTDIKSTIAELRYLADWAQHHLDKAKIANDAADAIEALQGEVERLKAFAELGVAMYEMTTTVHSPNIEFSEQLQIVPSLWTKCMEERDALQAENERLNDDCAMHMRVAVKAIDEVVEVKSERDAPAAKLDELQRQEPVACTLTEELTKRETTTRLHLWFL